MTVELEAQHVRATAAALDLIAEIRRDHPDIMFHQSGGCCDGSSPMCYPAGGFMIGDNDVLLGHIGGAPFYMSAAQFAAWQSPNLLVDAIPGRGGMFSLDNGRERRFVLVSDACGVDFQIQS